MKNFFSILLPTLLLSTAAFAQVQKLPSAIAKEMFSSAAGSQTVLRRGTLAQQGALRRYLQTMQQKDFKSMDEMLQGYFALNPQKASPKMRQQNQQIQKELVRKWVSRDFYASQRLREIQKGVSFDTVSNKINYAKYLPKDARLIMLGEVHEIAWMVEQVEEAILQFKKAHPDKKIYYASEFIDATPGKEVYVLLDRYDVENLANKRPHYQKITKRLLEAGVEVVGLENPAVAQTLRQLKPEEILTDSKQGWQLISAQAMQQRNAYWAQIIRQIYQQDPQAVVFVHAGLGHTDYNQPYSLPWILKEYAPFVIEFSGMGMERVNTLLERNIPIPQKEMNKGYEMFLNNHDASVYSVRHMTDKRSALVAGCDLHIKQLF